MEELARKLNKLKEYATRTQSGYVLSSFATVNTYDGLQIFHLHFRRNKDLIPPSFKVSIQFTTSFDVEQTDFGRASEHFSFEDTQSLVDYLSNK